MTGGERSIKAVTVYCSSSNDLHEEYFACARSLGEEIARAGRSLVYGGGRVGLMGEVARACRDGGGRVTGIITTRLMQAEQLDDDNHENIVVETMRERKALLEARGDAIVVLPGGLGTLEEFFEILVGRLLGEHDMPIVLVNSNDPNDPRPDVGRYYDPLLAMFDHMIGSRFAREGVRELFDVCESPGEVMSILDAHERGEAGSERPPEELMPTPPSSRAGTRGGC